MEFWFEILNKIKFSSLFIFDEFGSTKWVRVKGQVTSWCKERLDIVIEQNKWAQGPSIIYISARSGISKINNSSIALF